MSSGGEGAMSAGAFGRARDLVGTCVLGCCPLVRLFTRARRNRRL